MNRRFLGGLRPVLDALDPFLANLNPVIRYLAFYRTEITGYLTGPPAALGDTLALQTNRPNLPAPMHALRQLSYTGIPESFSVWANRLPQNRGNGYPQPNALTGFQASVHGIFPNFDCKNTDFASNGTGGDPDEDPVNNIPPDPSFANCFVAPDFPNDFGGGRAPNLFADP